MTWSRYQTCTYHQSELGFTLDYSRMQFPGSFLDSMEPKMQKAFQAMDALEKGAIANPDENRMVGHYWLRNPALAPETAITKAIETTLKEIGDFAAKVHSGSLAGEKGAFTRLLCIGIGGSALGPQFVAQALGHPDTDKLKIYFFDNTDPDGIDQVLSLLNGHLGETLVVVTSKSGGTPETRNGMVEAENAYREAGLHFARHAVAVTGEGSKLDQLAEKDGWLARFPMWDWVGGRTSELGPVGLLPAALTGQDIEGMLSGAMAMDTLTRTPKTRDNPAALLALMWYHATGGKGEKDMVILPYKDRLGLFAKYLQQLVMESLGKEKDLDGNIVHQGIAVYGNKGSTDQHAYVQQLREGVPNFFATFIEVLEDRKGNSPSVEGPYTSGDFLQGFLLGTRDALSEMDRESLTLTVNTVSAFTVGMLIALYERAVGFYGSLVNINPYHQPGVEAGKKAAASTLEIRGNIFAYLENHPGKSFTAEQIASEIGLEPQTEIIFKILEHLAANPAKGIKKTANTPFYSSKYCRRTT